MVYYDNSRKEELWNIIGADKDGNGDLSRINRQCTNSSLALTLDGSGVKLAKYTGSSVQSGSFQATGSKVSQAMQGKRTASRKQAQPAACLESRLCQ
ncbi:hypothetical protein PO124_09260 [Bacillus licheniformis]|nr:hypothetical protein [Bacillus licheniformis]